MGEVRTILAALVEREERASLRRILSGPEWALQFQPDFFMAQAELRKSSFGVVICAGRFADGHDWKDLLQEIQQHPKPPALIVADRLADDVLWAEVLNLGCYDLLVAPFVAEEVLRVVTLAWEFRQRQQETAPRRKPPMRAQLERAGGRALARGAE